MISVQRILNTRKEVSTGYSYWRINGTDVSWLVDPGTGTYFQALYTVSFFSSHDGTGTDLCLTGTANASGFLMAGYEPSNANDNNDTTMWVSTNTSSPPPQWWSCQLASPSDVNSVKILARVYLGSANLAKSYDLQYSTNGITWVTKASFTTANVGTLQTFTGL